VAHNISDLVVSSNILVAKHFPLYGRYITIKQEDTIKSNRVWQSTLKCFYIVCANTRQSFRTTSEWFRHDYRKQIENVSQSVFAMFQKISKAHHVWTIFSHSLNNFSDINAQSNDQFTVTLLYNSLDRSNRLRTILRKCDIRARFIPTLASRLSSRCAIIYCVRRSATSKSCGLNSLLWDVHFLWCL